MSPSLSPLTPDDNAVPTVEHPDTDTDRGLPSFVGVPILAFVATAVTLVVVGVLVGHPVTWDAAPGVIRNGLTAAGITGAFQLLFDRGE